MTIIVNQPHISWTKIVPLPDPKHGCPIARSSHGVSMVQGGSRLIVLGGEHIARTPIDGSNASWAADYSSTGEWQWRLIEATAPPPERIAHAQAVHQDAVVYVFGGRAGVAMDEAAMNDLWKLDCSGEPGTETWSPVQAKGGVPPEARSFHRMICVGDRLYVFGGCTAGHGRAKDLHCFDLETHTWQDLGASPILRGRGGPNLLPLCGGTKIGVIAGFAGEETSDGHVFDLAEGKWSDKLLDAELEGMRPRSVCACGSFPSLGYSVIFGGEVDPSDRGHEGAGAFENDVVVLEEATGKFLTSLKKADESAWPQTRGWSDSATVDANESGRFYIFGGLSGDDTNPERLDDFWVLNIQKS